MTRPRQGGPLSRCLVTSALFIGTYWAANQLTGLRSDVGSAVFDWEQAIPFVAWTIVPYLSICGFFVASFFLAGDPAELRRHATRLLLVLGISLLCYATFPLRFMFDRPAIEGVFNPMYGALAAFDLPYNRAPSLHIGVLTVLWTLYAPHLSGWARACLHGWFGLIAVSVLTTYQHHVVDVLAGFALGGVVILVTRKAATPPIGKLASTGAVKILGWPRGIRGRDDDPVGTRPAVR